MIDMDKPRHSKDAIMLKRKKPYVSSLLHHSNVH